MDSIEKSLRYFTAIFILSLQNLVHILYLEHISVWAGHSGAACGRGRPGFMGVSCQSHQGAWDFTFSAGCLVLVLLQLEERMYVCGGLCSFSEALGTPPVSGPLGHCRHLGEQDKHGSYPWEVYILLGVKSGEVADNY